MLDDVTINKNEKIMFICIYASVRGGGHVLKYIVCCWKLFSYLWYHRLLCGNKV